MTIKVNVEIMEDEAILSKLCSITDMFYRVSVPTTLYNRYVNGQELIQNIFPDLDSEQREFLISGWTPAEFDSMFGGIEE